MSLAKNYAKALYEVSLSEGSVDQTLVQLKSVEPFFRSNSPSFRLFSSPIASAKEKAEALEVVEKKSGVSPLVSRFLSLVIRRGRIEGFTDFTREFENIAINRAGGSAGVVVSSVELSSSDVSDIEAAFQKKLGKKILLRPEVDTSLIAGVRVIVDGITYDRSIRSQLDRLQMKFLENTF